MSNELEEIERLKKENDNWEKYNLEKEEEITQLNNKLVEVEAKANKYDSLVEKIQNKKKTYSKNCTVVNSFIVEVLQELLDTVEEETCEK